MSNIESKLISAVLEDKQVHVLLQANVENLLTTHADVWQFIRKYYENNLTAPPKELVIEKFRDFTPEENVGATKYQLEQLQHDYMNNSLREVLKTAAADVQALLAGHVQELHRLIAHSRAVDRALKLVVGAHGGRHAVGRLQVQ